MREMQAKDGEIKSTKLNSRNKTKHCNRQDKGLGS